MCLFKTENSGKYNIYKFLKNYASIGPKHPQTIGSTGVRRIWRSRALYLQRQTRHHSESFNGCSSHRPQSVLGSSICWFFNDGKMQVSNLLWDSSDQKRNSCYDHDLDTSAISRGKVWNTNLQSCLKWWLSIWQPCDTGLRPPFVGLGFMAKFENWKLPSSDCTCGQKISLLFFSTVPYPPLIEELSGTRADDDQMVFPQRIDSVAHDPKQAYQTWTQERACVPFEW